jgi:hypothetical protein
MLASGKYSKSEMLPTLQTYETNLIKRVEQVLGDMYMYMYVCVGVGVCVYVLLQTIQKSFMCMCLQV